VRFFDLRHQLACDLLHDGRADLMLAGAVNRADDLFIHQGFTALGALSPTGRSRPFHAEADGLMPAEARPWWPCDVWKTPAATAITSWA